MKWIRRRTERKKNENCIACAPFCGSRNHQQSHTHTRCVVCVDIGTNECIPNVFGTSELLFHALALQMVCVWPLIGTHSPHNEIRCTARWWIAVDERESHTPFIRSSARSTIKLQPSSIVRPSNQKQKQKNAQLKWLSIFVRSVFRWRRRKNYIDRIDDIRSFNFILHLHFDDSAHVYGGIASIDICQCSFNKKLSRWYQLVSLESPPFFGFSVDVSPHNFQNQFPLMIDIVGSSGRTICKFICQNVIRMRAQTVKWFTERLIQKMEKFGWFSSAK